MKKPLENIHIYMRYLLVIISIVLIVASQKSRAVKSAENESAFGTLGRHQESSSER